MNRITSLGKIKNIHFIGIGGAGMCGIAEVLSNEGFNVSGSDVQQNTNAERLKKLGIQIYIGHSADNIKSADVVVKSTSIKDNNPELIAAYAERIPVIQRAQMLGELMRGRHGIAVSGTHGKTTTTSLITSILTEAQLDPTFVIGGLLNSTGSNAKLGSSQYLIAEADESDASFLYLQPMMTVVTNIDADHMETYNNDFETLRKTFLKFIDNLPFYGLAVVCLDDPVIARSLKEIHRPICTYGFDVSADFSIVPNSCRFDGWFSYFVVTRPEKPPLNIMLKLPGHHNILNAVAAIAVAQELNIPDEAIQKALANFSGVGRRLQHHGYWNIPDNRKVYVLDDYGHHPREVEVTLDALKQAYPGKRILMVFQPHRYTRTRDLFKEFTEVLSQADALCLLPVYSAGEAPIEKADSLNLKEAIAHKGKLNPQLVSDLKDLKNILFDLAEDDDILLFQGAGNVGGLAPQLMAEKTL